MNAEEKFCRDSAGATCPTPPYSTGNGVRLEEVISRGSELTELRDLLGSNMNRVGMTAQRLKDFLQRVQGRSPIAEETSAKRSERIGTLGEIFDIAGYEADQLSDIGQYLNMLEEIG